MADAPKSKIPGKTNERRCQMFYSPKQIGPATAVALETPRRPTQNDVDVNVTEFGPPSQSADSREATSDNGQQTLPKYLGENSRDSIDSETSFGSTDPIIYDGKASSFRNREEFHSALSSDNSGTASHDLNVNFSPIVPFGARAFHEGISCSSSTDNVNRSFVKILHAASAYEFKRRLSRRFSSRGQASHRRYHHSLSFDSAQRRTHSTRRCGNFLRHSWSGSKSSRWALRRLSGSQRYHEVKSSSASTSQEARELSSRASFVKPAGIKLLVAVDVHRTLSGEPIVSGRKSQVLRPKYRRHTCGDDPLTINSSGDDSLTMNNSGDDSLTIRVDAAESLKKNKVRPPAAFNSNYQTVYGEIDESQGLTDGLCTCWLNAIDRITGPRPGCSACLGPALVTFSVLILLVCITAVVILFTWIFGELGSWG